VDCHIERRGEEEKRRRGEEEKGRRGESDFVL